MKKKLIRPTSIFLLLTFLFETIAPSVSYALTGGPSQAEVQSFEPIGTTELVDLFSGDFNYNIPIMDIDGYPINLAYHSGVTMDQEASWVGLGWNLNPGVVNRNMRGIPDDFNGDEITKELRHKADITYGVNVQSEFELFGFKGSEKIKIEELKKSRDANKKSLSSISLGLNMGINYNNYKGIGFDFNVTPSYSRGDKIKQKYSLGLNYSSKDGASLQPHVGLSELNKDETTSYNLGGGFNLNSRHGLKSVNLSFGITAIDTRKNPKGKNGRETETTDIGIAQGSNNSFSTITYIPNVAMPMKNESFSLSIKAGSDLFGFDPSFTLSGYKISQWLADDKIQRGAFGMQYLQNANGESSINDFNREKDGIFSAENPTLAIPQLTQDLYSYSAQGIGGMFKSYRNDIPVVSDPYSSNKPSYGGSLGGEIGAGNITKIGTDFFMNFSESNSGRWNNHSLNALNTALNTNNPLFEYSYFKNIGERTKVDKLFEPYKTLNASFDVSNTSVSSNQYHREKRDNRNVFIRKLNNSESAFAQDKEIKYKNVNGLIEMLPVSNSETRKPHHNSEISVTRPDGTKYIYGIAAYNNIQKEYSFTNAKEPDKTFTPIKYCETGEVEYDPSFFKFKGIDEHKEVITTPAYAHSYLLTNILSADYQDVDNNGASVNDLGNYTKINYLLANSGYKWRVPFNANRANYNQGLKSDIYDDNANFVYGEKEIWHVSTIEGKNHIAYFYVSERNDGYGVIDDAGGIGAITSSNSNGEIFINNESKSYKLDSIVLFSKFDLTKPIKTAVFEYDYYLCPNVPNNKYILQPTLGRQTGKLTLRKVYFKYGTSNKGKYNSYKFEYNDGNVAFNNHYHLKGYDSWGNFKPAAINFDNMSGDPCGNNTLLSTEFPYVEQNKALADVYTSQWTMSRIILPSGGAIEIEYESDDYAYVQDKNAMQMYRLLGFGNNANSNVNGDQLYNDGGDINNNFLFLEVPVEADLNFLKKNIDQMYYNILVDINHKQNYEYIRGYAKLLNIGNSSSQASTAGKKIIWVQLETVNIKATDGDQINPISAAGFNFTRLNLPHLINPDANAIKSGTSTESFIRSLYGFWPEMYNLFNGHNYKLIREEFCKFTKPEKSWIRLNNSNGKKLGGGCRVKKLKSIDNWAQMENSSVQSKTNIYTQIFEYTTEEGLDISGNPKLISSGVAAYEPITGGDENPFRELASIYSQKNTFIPNDEYFSEKPYGESYYPAANVGYSRVTVKSGNDTYLNQPITRTGTGKTVNEFYTAKDFPTIVHENDIKSDESGGGFIFAILNMISDKRLTMLQNQIIELNDMHGKPKASWNYKQADIGSYKKEDAISGIEYEYYDNINNGKRQLDNMVTVVNRDGSVEKATIGVDAEVVVDSREFNSRSVSGGIGLNLNVSSASVFLMVTLSGFPSMNIESTQFRSACSMKMVNKYGILKRTIAYEEGAALTTENTVFDAQTGEVLVSKTQNEFEDYIYNTTYPAHWVYEGMGQASINQGAELNIVPTSSTTPNEFKVSFKGNTLNPELFFYHGDLLRINNTNSMYWAYCDNNGGNKVWKIIDENGFFISISSANVKIMASGRKNMQSMPIANYTQLINPVKGNYINNNDSILSASVIEYDSLGKTNICFNNGVKRKECMKDFAYQLLKWFFDKNYFTIAKISNPNEFPNGVKEITIDPDDNLITSQPTFLSYDNFYFSAFKKCYPNDKIKVKLFAKIISGTPNNNMQFEVGYEFAPIDYVVDCVNYKVKLEAKGHTYPMGLSSSNSSNFNVFPPTPLNQSCSTGNSTSCTSPGDLDNNTEVIDIYAGETCDCKPSAISEGNVDVLEDGLCFDGDLGYLFELKYPGTNYEYNASSSAVASRPYPFNLFKSSGFPQARSILKVKNGTNITYARNFRHYFLTQYLETPVCKLTPKTEIVNPFKKGLQNNWKNKRSWVYVNNRVPKNGGTNIRRDGTYERFDNFWRQDLHDNVKRPVKNTTNWQFANEVTKYNTNGIPVETRNALDIYNSSLYGFNNTVPVAVANNAKYNQILSYNFEQDGSISNTLELNISCPAKHGMLDLQSQFIDTFNYHTGNSSYKIKDTITFSAVNCNSISSLYTAPTGNGYKTSEADYIDVFQPSEGKYVVSTWIKVGNNPLLLDYSSAGIQILLSNATQSSKLVFKPKGAIIEGWQKVEGTFTVLGSHKSLTIKLFSGGNQYSYFDDLRIQPFNSEMNTYVYDNRSLRIMAELDDNNFATFYEYDNEGNLVRIKNETEKGIVTVKEARNSFKKLN